jgi:hypothetical protein
MMGDLTVAMQTTEGKFCEMEVQVNGTSHLTNKSQK